MSGGVPFLASRLFYQERNEYWYGQHDTIKKSDEACGKR